MHLHTEYSLLDGACRIADIPAAVSGAGMDAVAVTDHGVLYGAVAFDKACRAAGVKPIIGCEVYVAPRTMADKQYPADTDYSHLVLLCENEIGYKNLSAIVSRAFTEGFYQKPAHRPRFPPHARGGADRAVGLPVRPAVQAAAAGRFRRRAGGGRSVCGNLRQGLLLYRIAAPRAGPAGGG